MSESPLFKRAFVRGLNAELIRAGTVVYPSKEAADLAADHVADNTPFADPHANPEGVTKEASLALCNSLVEASEIVCNDAGGYQPEVTKTAQAADPVDAANSDAWALMEKAAADTGSLMEGGDNTNDQPAAASGNAEAALEANRRPENYANLGEAGVGNYERKGQGNVGTEEAHPEKPRATETGTNSLIENTSKHGMEGMPPAMGGGAPPPPMAAPPGMGEQAAAAPDISPEMLEGVQLGVQLAAEDPEAAAAILAESQGGGGAPPMGAPPEAAPPAEGPPKEAALKTTSHTAKNLRRAIKNNPGKTHLAAGVAGAGLGAAAMSGGEKEASSLTEIIQKVAAGATGSLIDGGDVPNDQPAAVSGNAQSPGNAEAAQEANRRPENYANKGESGVGRSDFIPSKEENVGRERPHPLAPKATDKGKTNAPLEHIKGAAFDQLFEQTANELVGYLPSTMEDAQKVAHVRAAMGLTGAERGDYLESLYVNLGTEKTAAAGVKTHFLDKLAKSEYGTQPEQVGREVPMKTASISSLTDALSRLRA